MKRLQRNEINFNGQHIYIGIDVHKKEWQIAIQTQTGCEERYRMCSNQTEELTAHLQKKYPGAIYKSVYESGFTGFSTHRSLMANGIDNIIVNAADVPTSNKEKDRKTDTVDASKLARALRNGELRGIHVMDEDREAFRALERYAHTTSCKLQGIKARIKHFLHINGIDIDGDAAKGAHHWTKKFVAWLTEVPLSPNNRQALDWMLEDYHDTRLKLNQRMLQLKKLAMEEHPAEWELLRSIPGVGPTTAIMLIGEGGDLNRFRNTKVFASYLGLTPSCHQSGEKSGDGRITRRCNARLRHAIIESSWIATRNDPAMSATYSALIRRMPGCKAIIRVARKLANRILYVINNGSVYQNRTN